MTQRTSGRQPTSADVARAAGVSRSTVSYVLNETPGSRVSQETKARVLSAVQAVGYVANAAASDLRRGASRTVLLAIGQGRAAWAVSEFAEQLSDALRGSGLTLVSAQVASSVSVEDARTWAAMRPVAVLSIGAHLAPDARAALRASGALLIGEQHADVQIGLEQGAVAAFGAHALLAVGRNRLLQVLPQEKALAELTRPRVAAFRAAAGASSLGTIRMSLTAEAAASTAARILGRDVLPDAVLAHNDDYAAALVAALIDAGVPVPTQIAVLGCDNTQWGEWMRPALSTIAFDETNAIAQFSKVLLAIAHGEPVPATLTPEVTARVIHRQTT